MHTVHRDYDRVPFSPNYPNYYPPQYYPHSEIPAHEDAVHSVENPVHVTPYRNGTLPRKQEYDSQDLEPSSLLDTLIVSKETGNSGDRIIEVDSTASLPSEIVSLIISLESLSQSLSISHKQLLSHQLTRLSYSLQSDCLNPKINQNLEIPTKSSPSPPPITPRPTNTLTSTSVEQSPHPPPPTFTSPPISTDWSGPGSFPSYDQRPTNLDINHQRSVSVQFESQAPSFTRQISEEIIYANTSSPSPMIKDLSAPPLPPRDHFGSQVEYQNIPANRSSKKRIY